VLSPPHSPATTATSDDRSTNKKKRDRLDFEATEEQDKVNGRLNAQSQRGSPTAERDTALSWVANDLKLLRVEAEASEKLCKDLVALEEEAKEATRSFLDRMGLIKKKLLAAKGRIADEERFLFLLRHDAAILNFEDKSLFHQGQRARFVLENFPDGLDPLAKAKEEADLVDVNRRIKECQVLQTSLHCTLNRVVECNEEALAQHRSLNDRLEMVGMMTSLSEGHVECSICLNNCSHPGGNAITTLPCCHTFHAKCFDKLARVKVTAEQQTQWNRSHKQAMSLAWGNEYTCKVCPNCRDICMIAGVGQGSA
jgi:hypothetical protein